MYRTFLPWSNTELATWHMNRDLPEDADYAVEAANLARAQILQQAGTAMLAQANATGVTILSLLK